MSLQLIRRDGHCTGVPIPDVPDTRWRVRLVPPYQGRIFEQHVFVARVGIAKWICFNTSFHIICDDLDLVGNPFVSLGQEATPFSKEWRPLLFFDEDVSVETLVEVHARCRGLLVMPGGINWLSAPIVAAAVVGGSARFFSEAGFLGFDRIFEAGGLIRLNDGAVAMQRVACHELVPWLLSDRHTVDENESLAVFAKHVKARMDAVYARYAAAAQGDEAGSPFERHVLPTPDVPDTRGRVRLAPPYQGRTNSRRIRLAPTLAGPSESLATAETT